MVWGVRAWRREDAGWRGRGVIEDTCRSFDVSERPSAVVVVGSCDLLLFSLVRAVGCRFAFMVVKVL